MDQPPPELVDCPTCGAKIPVAELPCAACGKPLAVVNLPRAKVKHVGIATVMVMVAVLAVCFGAFRAEPGLGVLVALFLVPATLRASLEIESRRADGRPMRFSEKNDAIAASVMLAILLMPAAGIAFAATCAPIGCATLGGLYEGPDAPPGIHPGLIVAMAAGTVMGIFASYALGRKFWPRKDR